MKGTTLARLIVFVLIAAAFTFAGWQLLASAPQSKRERPTAPIPLVDTVDSTAARYPLRLEASGSVTSALELEIRPEVGGRLITLHPDFEPGGRIPAGEVVLRIEPKDYELAVASARAEIAKAEAAIALEQGRRVVAREELDSLRDSIRIDPTSQALALREPQLRQVRAELAAARNRLAQAELALERTVLRLPFDVVVLERLRVPGEVVGARELVGRVARADELWVELRVLPKMLRRLHARSDDRPGLAVTVHSDTGRYRGEILRIRAELASDSRLAGVIVGIPVDQSEQAGLLLGSFVQAEIEAGVLDGVIAVPRRALHDNQRVWVVDADDRLQVRAAEVAWQSGQQLLLASDSLNPGDRVVVSRTSGLVPGASVRSRQIDPDSGRPLRGPDRGGANE